MSPRARRWSPPRAQLTEAEVRQAEAERQAARQRSLHPDLVEDPDGDLRVRPDSYLPAAERDFRRTWADPSERAAFMERLTNRQRAESETVQRAVQGRQYGGTDAFSGYMAYQQDLETMREFDRAQRHGSARVVTSDELARMSLEETDEVLDEYGQPREGIVLELDRGVDVRRGLDATTRQELERRRQA